MLKTAGIILEPGSMASQLRSGWRNQKPVIDQSKCTKCLICWVYCPEPAIYKSPGGTIEINYDYCKGCGICAEECPRKAIAMVSE